MSFPDPPVSESAPSPPENVAGSEVVFSRLSPPSPPDSVKPMIPAPAQMTLPGPPVHPLPGWMGAPGSDSEKSAPDAETVSWFTSPGAAA